MSRPQYVFVVSISNIYIVRRNECWLCKTREPTHCFPWNDTTYATWVFRDGVRRDVRQETSTLYVCASNAVVKWMTNWLLDTTPPIILCQTTNVAKQVGQFCPSSPAMLLMTVSDVCQEEENERIVLTHRNVCLWCPQNMGWWLQASNLGDIANWMYFG